MAKSLLYKLHSGGIRSGVHVNPKLFREVHSSTHGLVRIYKVQNVAQDSKEWLADPANRNCDAPGSWYCPGNYPPKYLKFITGRRAFSQLEDFNKKGGEESAYTKLVRERQRKGESAGV